jgi:hypothetical protein
MTIQVMFSYNRFLLYSVSVMAPTQKNPSNIKDGSRKDVKKTPSGDAGKTPGKKGGKGKGGPFGFMTPGGAGFTGNLVSIIVIFLLLMSLYTLVATGLKPKPVVSLSQVANDVKTGQITTIKVSGNDLTLTYKDGTQKTSMKDPNDGLPQTLVPYGVTPDELSHACTASHSDDPSRCTLLVPRATGARYWHAGVYIRSVKGPCHRSRGR